MKIAIKKVLCPIDFSRSAAHATRYALAVAETHGAELLLLQVEEPYVPMDSMDYPGMDGVLAGYVPPDVSSTADLGQEPRIPRDDNLARLAADLRIHHESVPITPLRAAGKPFLEIVRIAKELVVDLIVMGTHGRTGWAHMLIGSTTERVVRMAPCPVLTVKHPEHEFIMP